MHKEKLSLQNSRIKLSYPWMEKSHTWMEKIINGWNLHSAKKNLILNSHPWIKIRMMMMDDGHGHSHSLVAAAKS